MLRAISSQLLGGSPVRGVATAAASSFYEISGEVGGNWHRTAVRHWQPSSRAGGVGAAAQRRGRRSSRPRCSIRCGGGLGGRRSALLESLGLEPRLLQLRQWSHGQCD